MADIECTPLLHPEAGAPTTTRDSSKPELLKAEEYTKVDGRGPQVIKSVPSRTGVTASRKCSFIFLVVLSALIVVGAAIGIAVAISSSGGGDDRVGALNQQPATLTTPMPLPTPPRDPAVEAFKEANESKKIELTNQAYLSSISIHTLFLTNARYTW
jgi:hypothetical protein